MIRQITVIVIFLSVLSTSLYAQNEKLSEPAVYSDDQLVIRKVADGVYMHTSFLVSEQFGNLPCNGMIVCNGREAVVFDTPAEDTVSVKLIQWVEKQAGASIKAVIPTHFHADCLGGLNAFHQRGIPSYANQLTIELAAMQHAPLPQHGFAGSLELAVGGKRVLAQFVGEGHTRDNIVGYVPSERVLFGGCLIKEVGAGEGNLEDATVSHWALTGIKLRAKYPEAKVIIPGHGAPGGTSLLDYTIRLFERYKGE